MLRNYLLIAIRNLRRNKLFSVINLTGLSVGMASAMLIGLWIHNEKSYDQFHANKDRLLMMFNLNEAPEGSGAWNATPRILVPTLKKEFPEVEDAARMAHAGFLFTVGEKHFNLTGNFTDTGFLKMFSFPLLAGSPEKALADNHCIVLTARTAQKLFGTVDVIGRQVKLDSGNLCTVTGVLKDLPANTRFDFQFLLPWSFIARLGYSDDGSWDNNGIGSYVLLKPGVSVARFNRRVQNIKIDHTRNNQDKSTVKMFGQPASDWHLYGSWENGAMSAGLISTVRYLGLIAAFILLIACINFMNLSTARSEKRGKEVGIRKVVGARRIFLVGQFLGESLLIALLAGLLALIMVQLTLPAFNLMVKKQLALDFGDGWFWLSTLGFILLTGVVAGSYPAFYLSSFKPSGVLKGVFKNSHSLVTPRKALVVIQFGFAILLIISTLIVKRQIRYARNRDAGYEKAQLAYAYMQGDIPKNYELIRNELLASGAAVAVNRSSGPMTQHWADTWGFSWEGSTEADKKLDMTLLSVDRDFRTTMGIKMLEGRDIDLKTYLTDSVAMVLNETAVKKMRLKNPVGQNITLGGQAYHVIGVMKDFILESPYEPVAPMIISPFMGFNVINMKMNPARVMSENLQKTESVFKKYNPAYPFEYTFVDEEYAGKFAAEELTGRLVALFAGLTILISCLGLFGLAIYMTENRVKEIGVRKVLGASVAGIATLLSKDFLKLVGIAFLIAAPLAAMAMSRWLGGFSYRIPLEWWVFGIAGAGASFIALLTVGFLAVKAALANPTSSLRSE